MYGLPAAQQAQHSPYGLFPASMLPMVRLVADRNPTHFKSGWLCTQWPAILAASNAHLLLTLPHNSTQIRTHTHARTYVHERASAQATNIIPHTHSHTDLQARPEHSQCGQDDALWSFYVCISLLWLGGRAMAWPSRRGLRLW